MVSVKSSTAVGSRRKAGPSETAASVRDVSSGGIRNTPDEMAMSGGVGVANWGKTGAQLLAAGVDTVHVGMQVYWLSPFWVEFRRFLESGKGKAAGSDDYRFVEKWSGWNVEHCATAGKGRRNYRYHLIIDGNHIWIADSQDSTKFGNVFVKFGSERLWSFVGKWGKLITSFLHRLVLGGHGRIESWHLSAVHLACDYLIPGGVDYGRFHAETVPDKMYKSLQGTEGDGRTCYLGKRQSPVSLAVYDKGKEITVSKKMWCLDLWGLDRSQVRDVVRVEARLSRAFWRKGLDDPGEVLGCRSTLSALWGLVLDKIQWRVRNGRQVNRRELHPFWALLRSDMLRLYGACADVEWRGVAGKRWDDLTYLERRVLPALVGWSELRGVSPGMSDILQDLVRFVESDPRAVECVKYRGLEMPSLPF